VKAATASGVGPAMVSVIGTAAAIWAAVVVVPGGGAFLVNAGHHCGERRYTALALVALVALVGVVGR
jgi:hypothetical protein